MANKTDFLTIYCLCRQHTWPCWVMRVGLEVELRQVLSSGIGGSCSGLGESLPQFSQGDFFGFSFHLHRDP